VWPLSGGDRDRVATYMTIVLCFKKLFVSLELFVIVLIKMYF
jgi:hypothetical protein